MTGDDELRRDISEEIASIHRDVTFEIQHRERPDRHPYQLGCLSGLLVVGIAQMFLGLPPASAMYEVVDHATVIALDLVFVVGCALALGGAYINRGKHFELSLLLGIWGHLSLFVGSIVYTILVMVSTAEPGSKPYWIAVTSVGLTAGIAYASVHRFCQMYALLREYRRRQRERNV